MSVATFAQQQQPVEITSEPSHHLVFENQYVRVFDVTVAPKASTLVHRHHRDYLFVTLGDSDVISARPGEKPVQLLLKDGETRFTPGNFSHAAINQSDRPFHNITIELLKPSTAVKTCSDGCATQVPCTNGGNACPTIERKLASDQWLVSMITIPAGARLDKHTHSSPHLVVAVSDLDMMQQIGDRSTAVKRTPGGFAWVEAGTTHSIANTSAQAARLITLDFNGEKQ